MELQDFIYLWMTNYSNSLLHKIYERKKNNKIIHISFDITK